MKKLVVLSLLCFSVSLMGQIKKPVKWEWKLNRLNATEAEIVFTAHIDRGWHIYSTEVEGIGPIPTGVEVEKSKDFELEGDLVPVTKPHVVFDSAFGLELGLHSGKAVFRQKIKIHTLSSFAIKGAITAQACNNISCIAPEETDFVIQADAFSPVPATDSSTALGEAQQEQDSSTISVKTENTQPATTIAGSRDNAWMDFWTAFGWGLLALLMPCVFPLIPMTVSFFLKGSENKTRARLIAFVFSASIVVIFFVLGILFSLFFGAGFANALSTHWTLNLFLFVIFLLFAASFFGMFEITLPASWINFFDKQADRGGIAGAFFMAFTTVLVSFSCTVPIIGTVLFSSMHGEFGSAMVKMLGFSLAIALPFGFFAFFPSLLHSLPRSGSWMNTLRVILGFLELALGLKFLSIVDLTYHWHFLNRDVFIAIWIVIFTLMGLYFLGKIRFVHDEPRDHVSVPRLLAAIVTFSFVVYLIPGLFGSPLPALSGYLPPLTTQTFTSFISPQGQVSQPSATSSPVLCDPPKYAGILHIPFDLPGYFDYDQALACARQQRKPLFIDFTGHGCANCRKMEENVWSHPEVMSRLRNNFIIVSLYVDDKTPLPENEWYTSPLDGKVKNTIGKKWTDFVISRYHVNAQPYYVILGPDEKMLVEPMGLDLNPQHFVAFLDTALARYKRKY